VVVHHTAIDDLQGSFAAFEPARLRARKKLKAASPLNVSTQFLVDRDGTVYRLMPATRMARHVIGLNWTAVGIENVGGDKQPLTSAQLQSNAKLIRYLKRAHASITTLIGHDEYLRFRSSPLWRERDPRYVTTKKDPGARFMDKLRSELRDLKLAGPPQDTPRP
jgi:N-acetyl-anhydromuramyl-L-alanine amidase AmpD